jgi:hypothetical protein
MARKERSRIHSALPLLKILWAFPCTLVGLVLIAIVILLRGKVRRVQGCVEATLRKCLDNCKPIEKSLSYRAITFGHVIIAVTEEELERLRAHELVHVRQYERWGIFFFPAYLASSLWQLLRRRRAYWDNYFEVQARRESSRID